MNHTMPPPEISKQIYYKKIGFVVNKTASRGKGLALFESVLPYIKEKLKDRDITIYITQFAGDGIKLAKKLIEEKNNLIVACGGDGIVRLISFVLI